MANSSTTHSNPNFLNQNQPLNVSFTFTTPIKLDRSNYLLWRKQVLTSIRGNRLEHYISGNRAVPDQYLSDPASTSDEISEQRAENPAYINWRAQDQILLGWLLSTINKGILSSVLGCGTSFAVWTSIEKQFGVQSEARVMQLRYEMNILRKYSMSIEEYCGKMKMLADKLACAGDTITGKDLLMRILNGLGSGYLDLASIITANKMDYDETYALLLTHEARLEQTQNATDVFNANYSMMNAIYSQIRGNSKRGSYGGGYHGVNGNFGGGYRGVNSNFGGGRRPNFGRDMFFQHYPRGFPSGNGNFNSYG
ncbi:hypothetical protein AB3S75_046864 [Citrus x aurantiifolia]